MDTNYNHSQHSEHSEHTHHHHHHHHHHESSGGGSPNTLVNEFKEYMKAVKQERKYKDSTSKYRTRMRQRRLRKKIMESLLLFVALFITAMVGLGVFYAYFIDKT